MSAVVIVQKCRAIDEGHFIPVVGLAHRRHVVHITIDGADRGRKSLCDEGQWEFGVLGLVLWRVDHSRGVANIVPAAVVVHWGLFAVRHGEIIIAGQSIGSGRRGGNTGLRHRRDIDWRSHGLHLGMGMPPCVIVLRPVHRRAVHLSMGIHVHGGAVAVAMAVVVAVDGRNIDDRACGLQLP